MAKQGTNFTTGNFEETPIACAKGLCENAYSMYFKRIITFSKLASSAINA